MQGFQLNNHKNNQKAIDPNTPTMTCYTNLCRFRAQTTILLINLVKLSKLKAIWTINSDKLVQWHRNAEFTIKAVKLKSEPEYANTKQEPQKTTIN